jgi:hypothetical protein
MSVKKAKRTHRVRLKGFEFVQCGKKTAERSEAGSLGEGNENEISFCRMFFYKNVKYMLLHFYQIY